MKNLSPVVTYFIIPQIQQVSFVQSNDGDPENLFILHE